MVLRHPCVIFAMFAPARHFRQATARYWHLGTSVQGFVTARQRFLAIGWISPIRWITCKGWQDQRLAGALYLLACLCQRMFSARAPRSAANNGGVFCVLMPL